MTGGVAVLGVLGQRFGHHRIEHGQFRFRIGELRWRRIQVVADHHRRVAVGERRGAGEKTVGGRGQGVLIGPPVERLTHQLLRCGVGHRADGDVGRGEPVDLIGATCDAEVGQHDAALGTLFAGEQDVGRLDVAVQQLALVRVVQCVADSGDDLDDVLGGHALGVLIVQQLGGVVPVDVVHRDPQPALEFAAVVHADDVRVPQRGCHVCLADEPLPEFVVRADAYGQHFESVLAG
nr:hypothetical protein CPGR_00080 [Mycolicibacterium fortuitum subsp. fortuitum DSM 46621 = ATCC 6841 = JCM 6387]